jgi:hypothetical protein
MVFAFSAFVFSQDSLVISEFMAINDNTIQDEDGDFPDWIELHNEGIIDISLNGWYLTDDENELTRWALPDITVAGNEYLIIFASGKDRKLEKDKLHTNFKLSGSGEFFALVKPGGTEFTTVFDPAFPEQFAGYSYGLYQGVFTYLTHPTPGAANADSIFLMPPEFSVPHWHYFNPFTLELTGNLGETEIYYTNDASTPTIENGMKYTGPIEINTTTVIRAITASADGSVSASKTQTYLFPDDVIHQSFEQPGYPSYWLSPFLGTDEFFEIPAEYGMHQNVVDDPTVSPVIVDALQQLPIVSVVSDIGNFFSVSTNPDSGGIYMYNGQPNGSTASLVYILGRGWERAASVEYFNAQTGSIDFQTNCCVKIHGGASRSTRKTTKYSFKLGFKSEYGPSKLNKEVFGEDASDQYDWLILRGGFAPRYGQQIRDPWVKLTYLEMGQVATHNEYVHLYINGLYWGLYNFSEQLDENFMRDYYGGSEEDYDVIKDYFEVEAGDTIAWTKLITLARDSMTNPGTYQKLLGNNPDGTRNEAYEIMIDPVNLLDYMLLNFYTGNTDWDHHNWLASFNRIDPEGFRFFTWDNEYVLRQVNDNSVGIFNANRPTELFHDLLVNEDFKNLLYDRINKHFFEGGALTPERGFNRYVKLRSVIDTAIICESARWNSISTPKSDIWENSYHTFINAYFPARTEWVLKQLISAQMYPEIDPPVFNTDLKNLPEDFQLHLNAPSGGEIRYTLDESDPGFVDEDNSDNVIIYDGSPIAFIDDTILVKARVYKEGYWSKLLSKQFIIGDDPDGIFNYLTDRNDFYFYSYPNPMQEYATIKYALPESSFISIRVYDMMGKLITILEEGLEEVGEHTLTWDSQYVPAGVYYCILENKTSSSSYRLKIIKR